MFYWVYDLSPLLAGPMFAIVFACLTWATLYIFRRFLKSIFHRDAKNNELVGLMLSNFSVLYALLVGLLAVAAYQNLTEVSTLVNNEASSLGALYRDVQAYPQPTRGMLQNDLRDYTRFTIDRAWPDQQQGIIPTEGTHRMTRFADDLTHFIPSTKSEEILHAEAYRQFNLYQTLQSSRIANVSLGIPSVFWAVVVVGSAITILLLAMLDIGIVAHVWMSGLLSAFLGLVIFLIASMDHPFRGSVSVKSAPFEDVYQSIMAPDGAILRSMSILLSDSERYGEARIEGSDIINGKKGPILFFGNVRMNGFIDIVDSVAKRGGGVATLFVKSGDDYVRVTTNVKMGDGNRAVGTLLAATSPAMKKAREGKAYYGEADILNKTYITGYEPIKNNKYETVGLFFVGYLKPTSVTPTNK